jgi:triosephosphate isomerase (TIM)
MKKLIIGNWKMNPETIALARQMLLSLEHRMHMVQDSTQVVICPPAVYLPPFSHYAHIIKLGAQNMNWADSGAYTGEISPKQLTQWGVEYVILGHSERRIYFGETDSMVNLKVAAALKHKMHPVVCLGGDESAKKPTMKALVTRQFNAVTKGMEKNDFPKLVYAYEPSWAISTMKNSEPASGEHAAELIDHIRSLLAKKIGKEHANLVKVVYGGTVNMANVSEFAKHPTIDGALVGGASLNPIDFWHIINEFARESIHRK